MSSGESGFTLIEVLVASLVLSVALLGIAGMSLLSLEQLERSSEVTHATALGQQRVELLRNRPFGSPSLAAGTTTETLGGYWTGYVRRTLIQDDVPMAGVKQITVTTSTPSGHEIEVVGLRVGP